MTRTQRIAKVLLAHAFDDDWGECWCGFAGDRDALAEHVAKQVEETLSVTYPHCRHCALGHPAHADEHIGGCGNPGCPGNESVRGDRLW